MDESLDYGNFLFISNLIISSSKIEDPSALGCITLPLVPLVIALLYLACIQQRNHNKNHMEGKLINQKLHINPQYKYQDNKNSLKPHKN